MRTYEVAYTVGDSENCEFVRVEAVSHMEAEVKAHRKLSKELPSRAAIKVQYSRRVDD